MTIFASLILYLCISNPQLVNKVLLFGFSSIGFFIGISKMLFSFNPPGKSWWLNQHLNGVIVVFAAPHASFLGLGLRKITPDLAGDSMHTLSQVGVIFLAFFLRWYLSSIRIKIFSKKLHSKIT